MNATTRTALAVVWLLVLAIAGYAISQRLQVSGDLRKFMPGQDGMRRAARFKAARAAGRRWATALFAVSAMRTST